MAHYQGINQSHELPEVSSPLHPHTPDTPYTPDLGKGDSNTALHDGSPFAAAGAGAAGASSAEKGGSRGFNPAHTGQGGWSTRKKWIVGGAVALICVIIAAVVGGVVGSRDDDDQGRGSANGQKNAVDSGADEGDSGTSDGIGRDGAMVTMDDGTTFRYNNSYGGYFVTAAGNNSARVREDVKSLDEDWDFSYDLMQGVNLGGWLVIEPFITPALFEEYNGTVVDEFDLSVTWGDDLADKMEEHYSTFITEKDFAEIAGAGLSWIRLPLPFWAIETIDGEPYLEGVAWKYFLKAVEWCRKYGIRMELDLHTVPGSQNGLNHSGKLGTVGWMHGVMGIVNAQRTINYVRSLTEFISQEQYANVIPVFMPVNEPMGYTTGIPELESMYLELYKNIRNVTGVGEGKGPLISFHDGFIGMGEWNGFLAGADRIGIESHPYLAFATQYFDESSYKQQITRPCQWWGTQYNQSMATTGLSWTGEYCLAMNDCGQYINEVGKGSVYDGSFNGTGTGEVHGDCNTYLDYPNYSDEFKNEMKMAALSYMDMSRNWFFWTWKTGANSTGLIPNPQWNYQLGLEHGWIPTDYFNISGACQYQAAELGESSPETYDWSPPLDAWMTGGDGAGDITASTDDFAAFPPTSMTGISTVSNLPTLTPTGTPITLSAPTSGSVTGDGWYNSDDDVSYYATPSGCTYMDPYSGVDADEPTAPCTGAAQRRRMARDIRPTAPPKVMV